MSDKDKISEMDGVNKHQSISSNGNKRPCRTSILARIKYRTQIKSRLKWYFNKKDTPKPSWFYPTDGWITDPKEVERIMRERGFEI